MVPDFNVGENTTLDGKELRGEGGVESQRE